MRPVTLLAAPLALVLLAGAVAASLVLRLGLEDLTERSGAVIEGEILSLQGEVDRSGLICTAVEVRVDRPFKGASEGQTFRFRVPGGEHGGRATVIAGMPHFHVGEDVLLFMTVESDHGLRMPVGLGQGKFRVVVEDGRRMLVRELAGLDLLDPSGGPRLGDADPQRFDYETLTAAVTRLLADDGEQR